MISWDLVEPCLYNFLGYGNLDSPVWFIGVEEGGAEVWRKETLTLEDSAAHPAGSSKSVRR